VRVCLNAYVFCGAFLRRGGWEGGKEGGREGGKEGSAECCVV